METSTNEIAVVLLAGDKQNLCFWPSYYRCRPNVKHDLIVVHRDKLGVPKNIVNNNGRVIYLNKVINGVDVPHKAFGGYRFAYQTYKDQYKYFIFISDDVVLKRDNWLLDIMHMINLDEKIGFGASQIFNGGKAYPHESHIRAPFWFAKTKALNEINWEFDSDHDGEMKIADQITAAGYFGVQVGSKIDLGYDVLETNHITQLLEKKYFRGYFPYAKYEIDYDNDLFDESFIYEFIQSPYRHIGKQNVYVDLEPFNGLIYLPSLEIAKQHIPVKDKGHNIYTI